MKAIVIVVIVARCFVFLKKREKLYLQISVSDVIAGDVSGCDSYTSQNASNQPLDKDVLNDMTIASLLQASNCVQ